MTRVEERSDTRPQPQAGSSAEIVQQFAAVADPVRLAILGMLRRRDHCVCHLVERLQLKQSVVSHHVGVLRRAGLVRTRPHPSDRRWIYYRLDREALADIADHLGWLLDGSEYDPAPLPCAADEPRRGTI